MKWPSNQDEWDDHFARVSAAFPLMVEDWDQHDECVDSGFYRVEIYAGKNSASESLSTLF